MKTTRAFLVPALVFTLNFSAIADVRLPRIDAPEELVAGDFAEGTLTQLSQEDIAEFIPWAQNAHNQLTRALNQARSLPLRERPHYIERSVRSVVSRSDKKQYQMFMRFALNRGMLLVSDMKKTMDMEQVGAQENVLDILQRSIQIALSFYESDLAFQQRAQSGNTTTELSYARFGAAFMSGMAPGIVNVLDAKAQYQLMRKLVEMVNWDLSRDGEARRYAEMIVEAHELLQDLPAEGLRDDRSNLRLMRRLNGLQILSVRAQHSAPPRTAETPRSPISEIINPPAGDMVNCNTSSRGYNFNSNTRSSQLSRSQAIAACQGHNSTVNAECSANVSCNDGQSYHEFVSCNTSSRGYNFNSNTRNPQLSRDQAIAACQGHSSTVNAECSVNVSCI